MEQFIKIIKPQFISLIREKRYNTNFLELEDLGNEVIKIYYNHKFIRYLDLNKYSLSEIKRPYSDKWNKFRSSIISEIVRSYTRTRDSNIVCVIPVWRNHKMLEICVSSLRKQSIKPDILLLISCEEDKNFAIMYNLEFIQAPRNQLNKIKVGYNYVRNNSNYDFIMLANQNELYSNNWISAGCKLLSNYDIVGKNSCLIIDKYSNDTYRRTINNDKAKIFLNSRNDFVFNGGKLIKRCLLDRINWSAVKDYFGKNDISLFNYMAKNKLKVGVIKKSGMVSIINEKLSDYLKNNDNTCYEIDKLKSIPK
jgi:hypothetical protein